jgi:hypothetical protein
MSERALPLMLLLALGVVAYQNVKTGVFPPPVMPFVGVALVFSLLSLLAIASPELAAVFGLAVVIWLVLAYHGALAPATAGGAHG